MSRQQTFYLLLLVGLVFVGCGPKTNLEGWFKRGEGRWDITGGLVYEIRYSSEIDSTTRPPDPIIGAGFFQFNKDNTGNYAFEYPGSEWSGSFSYIGEDEFLLGTVNEFSPNFNRPRVSFYAFDVATQSAGVNLRYDDFFPSGNRYAVVARLELARHKD